MNPASSTIVTPPGASPVALAWRERAPELARWTWEKLVCRDDVWGGYLPERYRTDGSKTVTKPRKDLRGRVKLTQAVLQRHYEGRDVGDIAGLHSTSPANTGRAIVFDYDNHDDDPGVAHTNLTAAVHLCDNLTSLGFRPLLIDSNGKGGFHIVVVFNESIASATLYSFAQWLVSDYAEFGLAAPPETFPKQAAISEDACGNWYRLPGRHHTRNCWSRLWDGRVCDWVEGHAAIHLILATEGDDVMLVPEDALPCQPDPKQKPEPKHAAESPESEDRLSDIEVAERCLRHIPNNDCHYDLWLAVAGACSSVGALDAFRDWSRRSTKHDNAKTDKTWNSFHRRGSGRDVATLGTLVHLARHNGFDVYEERRRELREKHGQAEHSRPAPRPLPGAVIPRKAPVEEPFTAFPLDALPPVMAEFAKAVGETVCVDPSLALLPMLTVAGAAVGNAVRARMNGDWAAPPNVWTAPIMRSGERKSPVLKAVVRPLYDSQREQAQEHAQAVAEYESRMEEWKAKPKAERGDRPLEPPPFPHLYLNDATTEAIAIRLAQQPRGFPVVLDELSALFTGMNQYRAKGGHDREFYLAAYDANTAKIDRKSATPPVIFIPRAFVAVTGMIQPGTLASVLRPGDFDSGLAARFLMASPPPQRATWSDGGIPDRVRDAWHDVLGQLLAHPLPEHPVEIPPSDDAMRRWAATHDRLEEARHKEPDDRLRAAAAKLIGVIPRLALICQMVSAGSGEAGAAVKVIDDTSMRRAIEMAEWFGRETRRVYRQLSEQEEGSDDDVIDWIARRGGECTPRELGRHGRCFRAKGAAESYFNSLVSDGIGRWEWRQTRGRPTRTFLLLNAGDAGDGSKTPDSASETGLSSPSPLSPRDKSEVRDGLSGGR